MEALREVMIENAPLYLAAGGLVIGFIFGVIVFRTNFCTMGSISDFMTFGDFRRFRSWLLAIGIALIGTQAIAALGYVNLEASMHVGPSLNWLGHVGGGLMFGFGMVFAGGCASRNLVRVGGGDLRAMVVLLMVALFAFMTIGGILGPLRDAVQSATAINVTELGYASNESQSFVAKWLGMDAERVRWGLVALIGGGFIVISLANSNFRSSPNHLLAGLLIGVCIVAGWFVTGLAYDELADNPISPGSLTFVRPTGDWLEFLRRYTASTEGLPSFGGASVVGTILGGFFAAILTGKFHLVSFAGPADMLRNLVGGAMMGIGGVVALGCTVGQAMTGVSTLAAGSLITFAAIVVGGIIGVKVLERMLV